MALWNAAVALWNAAGWDTAAVAKHYLDTHRLGVASGADGMACLFGHTVREPDVAFVAWDCMSNGQIPTDPIPDWVPNFVIQVLGTGNTYAEMPRKRHEYIHRGANCFG